MWSKSMDWFLYDNGRLHERVKFSCTFNIMATFLLEIDYLVKSVYGPIVYHH